MENIVLYTCITNGKDSLKELTWEEGVRYVCFSDKPFKHSHWEYVPTEYTNEDPRRIARYYKALGLELFKEAEWVIWIDGHLIPKIPIKQLISELTQDIASHKHKGRDCIYQEFDAVKQLNLDDNMPLILQRAKYKSLGMPERLGLFETGLLFRKNTPLNVEIGRLWWNEINRYSKRDQLSFTFVLWSKGVWGQYLDKDRCVIHQRHSKLTSIRE